MESMILALLSFALQAGVPEGAAQGAVPEIRALLERQQGDWNRGDLAAFMEGYERGEALVFSSGGRVRRGWQEALRRYRETYPDRDAMGRLEFSGLEITPLGRDAALVLGNWELTRKNDHPHGVFTLVLRRSREGWKIIHDHTSASP